MSLVTPKTPLEIVRAFTTGLGDFVSPRDPLWSVLLKKFFALEQFNLDLDKSTQRPAGPLASITNASGWRFLAADGDLYGGCHVGSVFAGLSPKVTGFSRDVEVLTTAESFSGLDDFEEVKQGPFEPRVLRVAWLRFEAFWLRFVPRDSPSYATPVETNGQAGSRDESRDLVIPFIGFVESPPKSFDDTKLERGNAYSVANFLTAVGSRRPALPPSPPRRPADVLPDGSVRP
jgi:hypothetical protein